VNSRDGEGAQNRGDGRRRGGVVSMRVMIFP
jgi:hypothetical protein